MKSITVEEWTDALRSGEYKQGKYALRNTRNEFCCLGVACDLLGIVWKDTPKEITKIINNPEDPEDSLKVKFGAYVESTTGAVKMPPENVKFPLPEHGPEITQLAKWNDEGKTFEEIADEIETMTMPTDQIVMYEDENV